MDEPQEIESIEQDFEVIAYNKPDGTVPVDEFLDSIPNKLRTKTIRDLFLLEEYGNDPQGKRTKHLDDGIFEVRSKQSSNITRVLYFFRSGKKIILTHGFIKKTQKTPPREISLAKKYRADYLDRLKKEENK